MKKFIFFLLLSINLFAQDVSVTPYQIFYHDTLTTTIDSVDIKFIDDDQYNYFTISAYTTTGTDTLQVFNLSLDNLIWTQVTVKDKYADTTISAGEKIAVTTTPKEYEILTWQPHKIRLITPDTGSASLVFTVNAKKE